MEKITKRKRKGSKDDKRASFSESITKQPRRQASQEDRDAYGIVFWITVTISQILAVAIIALLVRWGYQNKGFDFSDADLMFNYHPLFMVLGLVICYGDAIIVYRVFSFLPKQMLKIVHAVLHILEIIFSSLALVAVFENHRRTNKADMYSLHSWVGIATFAVFCLQYIGGFVAFLFPGLPADWRSRIMPYHLFFGIGLFCTAVATAGMGISEKLAWTPDYDKMISKGIVGNAIGLLMLVFAFLIVFIATHSSYKRKPRPTDMPSFSTN